MYFIVILFLSMEYLTLIQGSSFTEHEPSNDTVLFDKLLKKAKHILVITGAGISAASGIPTYRGSWGNWRGHQSTDLDSLEMFTKSPALVWEFNQYRRNMVLNAIPNAAHNALADYEKLIKSINPRNTFTIITQNIDGLHSSAGSTDVIEMHGSLFKTRCLQCGHISNNWDNPICKALLNRGSPDLPHAELNESVLPHCDQPDCSGLLRPFIVWYGEQLGKVLLAKAGNYTLPLPMCTNHFQILIESALRKCDLCLVVGTSSVVNPVAIYAPRLAAVGVPVAEFNTEPTEVTSLFQFFFKGPCAQTLPKLLKI